MVVLSDGEWVGAEGRNAYMIRDRDTLIRLQHTVDENWIPREIQGVLQLLLHDEAFAWLQKALDHRSTRILWLEVDLFDPGALAHVRHVAPMPVCSGENLYGARQFRPHLEAAGLDVAYSLPLGFSYRSRDFLTEETFAELTELHEFSGNRFDMSQPFPIIAGARAKERARLPGSWFDYPDLELGGILMTALNEMLLQSHDGVIRVFPSLPAGWRDASFQLRAAGGFLVSGEKRGGEQPGRPEPADG